MYIYITCAQKDVIPARELAGMDVSSSGGHLERPRHDRSTSLQRRPERLQLLWLELELHLKVGDVRRPGGREVVEQPIPVRVARAHALDLGTADRIQERRDLLRHEQILPAVHGEDEVAAFRELAEPRPFRSRPLPEAGRSGFVRL